MTTDLILIGAGGHSKVVADIVTLSNLYKIIGFYDDNQENTLYNIPHLGTVQDLIDHYNSVAYYICAIGDNMTRSQIVSKLEHACVGIKWVSYLTHPSAIIASTAQIGCGTIVCAGSIIQPDTTIGCHCIVNTSSSIDHDCAIGDFTHIAPGTHLCGNITIGNCVLIGVGCCIVPNRRVGNYAIIGAGTTVIKDVPESITIFQETKWKTTTILPLEEEESETKGTEVGWVARKKVCLKDVATLLVKSEAANHYANYGPCAQELERYLTTLLGISYNKAVIVTNNATSALHALCSGIDLYYERKMTYGTQAFTFPCSAQGPLAGSLIFDIDEQGGLDLNQTLDDGSMDGMIVTNCFGNLVDLEKYCKWQTKHNKILLFDNAACPYSFYNGENALNFGNGSIVSFHHTKLVGFGEGGAIIVDKKFEHMVRRIINFGYDVVLADYKWHAAGSNYKISDISAAWILAYLQCNFVDILKHNMDLCTYFRQRLVENAGQLRCKLFPHKGDAVQLLNCIAVLMDSEVTTDDQLETIFKTYQIRLKKYYHPLQLGFRMTDWFWTHIVCFPCHSDVTHHTIDIYIQILKILTTPTK